uniref:Uncharacterized protein n=1 Tax=Anguilla anguilla TaxID=7936 RepID=A0A0E9Q358_ANGAN
MDNLESLMNLHVSGLWENEHANSTQKIPGWILTQGLAVR